jgi:hypothetical protein
MINYIFDQCKQSKVYSVVMVLFIALTGWWASMYFRGLTEGLENDTFTVIYCILALLGSFAGVVYAQKWGGFKSILGRSISFFTLGLFAQFIGQVLYNYYIYVLGVEVPYPSIGDVSFFASVIFYILGVVSLAKVSGAKFSYQSISGKFLAFALPVIMLLLSYIIFLKDYQPDWSNLIIVFLDFGFPVGQAIYVSIALFTLMVSRNKLGGVMRRPILLIIFALIVQYLADFSFSYQVAHETWYVGGINDYLFAVAYFLMATSLFTVGTSFNKIKDS